MSKDDSGLLSKVVKFVRNPTTNWADLDPQESDRESTYSKQMLKEMIERKRRNDFVRKREFDMLRKMRRSEVMAGQDPMARPSFFQSSMPSKPDDRATTLKKIDEIEAQMSMQWWKTKHGDSSMRSTGGVPLPNSAHAPIENARVPLPPNRPNSYNRTAPQPLDEPASPAPIEPAAMLDSVAPDNAAELDAPSSPVAKPVPPRIPIVRSGPVSKPVPQRPISAITPHKGDSHPSNNSNSVFSASKLIAIDVDEFAHDPELEEAAIRFANGDDAGAEAGLLEVLSPQGTRIDHDETWLTLFDLYRATGQLDRYEAAAIEFAGRFARSAPQWVSLPDAVSRMKAPAAAAPPLNHQIADWTCTTCFATAPRQGTRRPTPRGGGCAWRCCG